MEWEDRPESENVEDRRGAGRRTGLALGGGGLVVLILALIFGVDPQKIAGLFGPQQGPGPPGQVNGPPAAADPEEDQQARFSKVVFRDTEVVWDDLFQHMGKQYRKPVMVLYSDQVESACGMAESAVGPFYCPGDGRVYLDLSFYRDMQRKLHAPGDFARAYVIAHEVGHHVQKLLGYSRLVDQARRGGNSVEAHHMSVRLELQADYLAGVWAYHGQKKFHFLERGDIESALNAAFQIGDDRLQKKARGYVVPDSFTHGTSKQRQRWFEEGFRTGDVDRARQLFDLSYNSL
jgi:uncharacterized protein